MEIEDITRHPALPSIPEAVIKLNELITNDAPLPELASVLETEPALSLRTLELANSAWYKRERTIKSVRDAIAIIGMPGLYQLIFSTSVARAFRNLESSILDMDDFWRQSLQTASVAETIAANNDSPALRHIFTTGLVLYIGRLALVYTAPHVAKQIFRQASAESIPLYIAEQQQLGFTHNDISVGIMQNWKIPEVISAPASYYLDPQQAPADFSLPASTLNVADHIQSTLFPPKTSFNSSDINAILIDSLASLELVDAELPEIARAATDRYTKASAILDL